MSFWGRKKKRFTLERLKELWGTLAKNPIITDRNKGVIVETLREIAELMIWGDQHDPQFFDFFLEKNILGQFLRIMGQKSDTSIHVQLLQTLSILLENISEKSSLYYLLSNDRVNDIITFQFDFSDEELLAYYISFLKTLSLKLDNSTVQFFFNHVTQQFPLYTESIKFFNHSESMVRVGVRTMTLAVFKVDEPAVRAFVVGGRSAPYFNNLVWFIQSKCAELQSLRERVLNPPPQQPPQVLHQLHHKFRDCVDELNDLLYYIQDIYNLQVPELSQVLTTNLMEKLFGPNLLNGLLGKADITPLVSLYVLSQAVVVVRDASLVHQLTWALLDPAGPSRDALMSLMSNPSTCLAAALLLYSVSRNPSVGVALLERTHLLPFSLDRQQTLLAAVLGESPPPADVALVVPEPQQQQQQQQEKSPVSDECREQLLHTLVTLLASSEVSVPALQCVSLLVKAVSSNHLSPLLLKLLRQALSKAGAPLRDLLRSSESSASVIDRFESGLDSYKQLVWTKLAQDAPLLLGVAPIMPSPHEHIHRFLVVRDLWHCCSSNVLEDVPLQPSNIPLSPVGQKAVVTLSSSVLLYWVRLGDAPHCLAVYATHVSLLRLEDDVSPPSSPSPHADMTPPALCGTVLHSLPIQHASVSFVLDRDSVSESMPASVLRVQCKEIQFSVQLDSAEKATEARQAIVQRKNAIVDSKLQQLSALIAEPKADEDEKEKENE